MIPGTDPLRESREDREGCKGFYHAGCLTDAMLGLMEKTGSDAQANLASTAEVRKTLQSPR